MRHWVLGVVAGAFIASPAFSDTREEIVTSGLAATLWQFTATTPKPIAYYQKHCSDKAYLGKDDPFTCTVKTLKQIEDLPLYYSVQEICFSPGPTLTETVLFTADKGVLTPVWELEYEELGDGNNYMKPPAVLTSRDFKLIMLHYIDAPSSNFEEYAFSYQNAELTYVQPPAAK